MKALILNILIPVIIALLPYQITIIPMSQELYTREQVRAMILDADKSIDSSEQIDSIINNYESVTEYFPVSDHKLTCSNDRCDEAPFICLCTEHYNEIIQNNVEQEKIHEDHIIEPTV